MDILEDLAIDFLPASIRPAYLTLRVEKYNMRRLFGQFTREILIKRQEEKSILGQVLRLLAEKEALKDVKDPIARALLSAQKVQELKSAGKTLCTVRLQIKSTEKSISLVQGFRMQLDNATADSQLKESIGRFNAALGENQEKERKRLQMLARVFERNIAQQGQFRAMFQESVQESVQDEEVVEELDSMSRLIGVPLVEKERGAEVEDLLGIPEII